MRALLLVLLLTVSTGCGSKTEGNTERKADEAARTTGEPAASREDQDKATEALQARGEAKVLADNAKEAADSDVAKANKLAHDRLQRDFDVSDRRFNPLKEKVAKATGAKKTTADAAAAEVTKRETTVMASIAKLREATGAEWNTTRTQVEADLAALDTAIDALETALQ